MSPLKCPHCGGEIPNSMERCPHCAQPGIFPNVRAAEEPDERAEVARKYADATRTASARGWAGVVGAFETAIANARAVIARPLGDAHRLAASDKQGYATHYQLIEAEVKIPDNDRWNRLREVADVSIFSGYHKNIRFAALSIDGSGLPHYGNCWLTARDVMIAHRASLYEENSAVFVNRRGPGVADEPGHRGMWDERGRFAVAKLAGRVNASSTAGDFAKVLLEPGRLPEEDQFIEVNIWGPMTIRTFEKVVVARHRRQPSRAIMMALKEKLDKHHVVLEER